MKPAADSAKQTPETDHLYFTDRVGTQWEISERDGRFVPGSRGARCLICMADNAVRRVWVFPTEWRHLEKHDLQQLVDRPCRGKLAPRPLTRGD